MVFKKILPNTALRSYVKDFWFFDSEGLVAIEEALLPSGFIQIAFNLGKAEWQSKLGDNYKTGPNLELFGQQRGPSPTKIHGHTVILGISFHPHTACYFLDDKAILFSNNILDLNDIFGKDTEILYEMLLSENDLDKRIGVLEKFLIKKLREHSVKGNKRAILDYMVSALTQQVGVSNTSVKEMATKTGYSDRYIEQLFKEYIGVTPKELQKIHRFHESLRQLNGNPDSLTDVAYTCGYSDQAHFIKDFSSYTGITPSAYQAGSFSFSGVFL